MKRAWRSRKGEEGSTATNEKRSRGHSRSVRVPLRQTGFTLIELLVVIAIIGLLSSIVLANLAQARQSARNSYTTQTIRQYMNALELYKNEHGGYPRQDNWSCLGPMPSGASSCLSIATNEDLELELREFIRGWSTPNPVETDSSFSPGSVYYSAPSVIVLPNQQCDPSTCKLAVLRWTMERFEDDCVIHGAERLGADGAYICQLLLPQ